MPMTLDIWIFMVSFRQKKATGDGGLWFSYPTGDSQGRGDRTSCPPLFCWFGVWILWFTGCFLIAPDKVDVTR